MATNPKYVLTPFMLSALLTISNVSRYLESVRLSVSSVLPFIRSVIQNNEKEVEMCNTSAWFRDTLEHSTVDVNKVYSILVEQRFVSQPDSKQKKISYIIKAFYIYSRSKEDIFTPGLVGMAFVLLKASNYSSLNVMGILFLEEIVKNRHQLGYGILRNIKEFLFADQEAPQYTGDYTMQHIEGHRLMIRSHIYIYISLKHPMVVVKIPEKKL